MFKPDEDKEDRFAEFKTSSKNIIDKIVRDVRNISHNLSPTTLRYYGLAAAVTEHCTIINQSGKLEVNLLNQAEDILKAMDINASTAIYRVLEELLNNTIKHSGASKANISFKKNDNALVIDYEDNGKGLSAEHVTAKKGMGLQNIESRLMNINATYVMDPYLGKGFHTSINYPVN